MPRRRLLLLLLLVGTASRAAPVVPFGAGQAYRPFGHQVDILRDPSHRLTFADVTTGPARLHFRPSTQAAPNLGFTNDDVWVRFRLRNDNPASLPPPVLEIGFTHYVGIELFVQRPGGAPPNGAFSVKRLGTWGGVAARELPGLCYGLRLPLPAGTEALGYLHLSTDLGQQYFPLTLWQESAYLERSQLTALAWGVYYGALLLVLLYHLFVYALTRERGYLLVVAYLLCWLPYEMSRGYAFAQRHLWPSWFGTSWAMPTFLFAGLIFYVLFYGHVLRFQRVVFRFLLPLTIALVLLGLGMVYGVPHREFSVNKLVALIAGPVAFVLTLLATWAWARGQRTARFYALASASVMLGAVLMMVQRAGLIASENVLIKFGSNVGSLLEFIFLTLGLADTMRERDRENRALREARIRQEARAEAERDAAQVQGQVMERRRVAAQLHDHLGSNLYGLRLLLRRLRPETLPPAERDAYHDLAEALGQAHRTVRLIAHNLLPAELEREGLMSALERLVASLNRHGQTEFSLKINGNLPQNLASTLRFQVYSTVLELAQNVLRHAEAQRAEITLDVGKNRFCLTVLDDGVGLPPAATGEGQGLRTLAAHLRDLGGALTLDARPGGGTCAEAWLPLAVQPVPEHEIGQPDRAAYP